jgi:tRNA G10  N-methylase Trm11
MPTQYFFQAGSFRDLSYAELVSVFEIYNLNKDIIHNFSDEVFLIKSNDISEDVLREIFNRLGGFVRFGKIIEDTDTFLKDYENSERKIIFGLSILNDIGEISFLKRLGNQIKRELKESGISSRFLFPKDRSASLNAAQILNNDILERGFELCILRNDHEEIYGKTLSIQDIEGYIERDLDRPYSDMEMGILPPKLARMMVNLTGIKEGTVWDPFCGSGTILMESAILGYNFLGSDKDDNAVFYTDENIKWLNSKGKLGDIVYETFKLDIANPERAILKKLKNTNISAIVCEPFMGPPQKRILNKGAADELLKTVKALYLSLFDLLDNEIGVRGVRMVMILPSYKTDKGWESIGIRDIVSNRWEVLNSYYSPHRDLKWSRKNSIITRNIFILQRS